MRPQAAKSGQGSPSDFYRATFRRRLLEFEPGSVLDVGCGDGRLLELLAGAGVRAVGVELERDAVRDCRDRGLNVEVAAAEALPFPDGAFDWVVGEFSLHHFADPPAAVGASLRVARSGIAFLDQWYDETEADQRVARAFDRLSKRIDRASGMIHHDDMTTAEVAAMVAAVLSAGELEVHTIRLGRPVSMTWLDAMVTDVARCADLPGLANEARALLAAARTDGMSVDGAQMHFCRHDS